LSKENRMVAEILLEKFQNEENCAGLAAPQIGFGKRIIVYAIPEDTKNYRNDADEIVEMRVLINPEYEPIGDVTVVDWEGCFSVANTCAEVPRFQEIRYKAYDMEGRKIEGIAKGFHARLLQHEIGHINGQLFIDLVTPGCRSGSLEEMRALRKAEFEAKKKLS
ncbi:MAG: peptide deformylase, partial [Alphaproteobacteria bacterium]|nr:peptide deformylase [Alphaproteobacteria bacterium]